MQKHALLCLVLMQNSSLAFHQRIPFCSVTKTNRGRNLSHPHPSPRYYHHPTITPTTRQSSSATALSAFGGHHHVRAVTGVVLATAVGKSVPASDGRILVTLGVAALLSNVVIGGAGGILLRSPVYDACWDYGLPGSLVLLLWSLAPRSEENDDSSSSTIRRMGPPFILASLASIAGCAVALALNQWWHRPTLLLSPRRAGVAALACLLASFIGGSVNFMATARLIAPNASSSSSWVSAMAAADVLVMAVYFALLGVASASPRLRAWVMGRQERRIVDELNPTKSMMNSSGADEALQIMASDGAPIQNSRLSSSVQWIQGSVVALTLTGVLVEVARRVEAALARVVPGTACGLLALLAPACRRYVPRRALAVTSFWSEACFLSLFASIGMTAHVGSALRTGPGCLILSLTALAVHVIVLLAGAALWNRVVPRRHSAIALDTALIASNAAIGGPATAAAWAGRTAPRWALAATVWGVVGYATGTTVGVWFYRIARRWCG